MIKCSEVYTEDLIFGGTNAVIIHAIASIIDGGSYDINAHLSSILSTNKEFTEYDYLLNRQDRILSPLFERILLYNSSEENHLMNVSNKLGNIIINKFLFGWSKLADAMFGDYNPIENYNMKENRETDFNENTVNTTSQTVTNKFRGFNADDMNNVSESDTSGDMTNDKTDTGSKIKNELTRSGNIGVTTSQQMIESEFNLRKKNLINLIYRDIDSVLFIDYYC